MTLVSVLMSVYNVESYIEESVKSILNQTHRDIELIIVDDHSGDNTYKILSELQENDGRIKLYRNAKNLKIVESLNFAFKKSKGEYICRMDGDDVSDSKRIEKKLNYLKTHPDISLVGCNVLSIDENGRLLNKKTMPTKQSTILKTLKYATPVFHIWLAKREVYDKLRGYRNIPFVEDYDFLLRMTSLGLKYSNIPEYYGYSIRLRKGNTLSSAGIFQRKAHRYCFELYKKRIKASKDDFSIEAFWSYVVSTPFEITLFNKSTLLLQKALLIESKFAIRKYVYILLSYLLSQEQRKYINGRLKTQVLFRSKLLK